MNDDKKRDSLDEVDEDKGKAESSQEKAPASTDSAAPADDDIIIK